MLLDKILDMFKAPTEDGVTEADARRAVAALVVHVLRADGVIDSREEAQRDALLKQKFGLNDTEAATLVAEAEAADDEAIDLFRFTNTIKQAYDRDTRERIVEMLWAVVLADGHVDSFESHLVRRVAGLLGFDNREWVELRQRAEASVKK